MNRIFALSLVAVALTLCGCTNNGTTELEDQVELISESNPTITAEQTSLEIEFSTAGGWSAQVQSEGDWFSIDPVEGAAKGVHKITVTCPVNTSNEKHTGTVIIKCGEKSAKVTITQSVGEKGSLKNIRDYSQSSLKQSAYADEVRCVSPFTFTTTLPWSAKIATVTASGKPSSDPVWFKINQSSGSAGAASIQITFPKNYTGLSRCGSIEIECGDEVLTINLIQSDKTRENITPKDPKIDKLVDKITHVGYDEYVEYIYDSENRPVKCLAFYRDPSGLTSDYWQRNPIVFEYGLAQALRKSFNGAEYVLEKTISLANGVVTTVVVENDPVNGKYSLEDRVYDRNRLISNNITFPATRSEFIKEVITYTWNDFYITSIETKSYANGELYRTSEITIEYDNNEGNISNIDIFQLLLDQTMYPLEMFTPFEYYGGIRADVLPGTITMKITSDAGVEDLKYEYSYDRNSDGNITAIYSKTPVGDKTAIFRLDY